MHKSPRATVKPDVSGHFTQRTFSTNAQSRIQDRLTSSPLKIPLEKAIKKTLQRDNSMDWQSQSRVLTKSKLKDESRVTTSRLVSRNIYKEDPDQMMESMHTETHQFLKKYFSLRSQELPLDSFIESIMKEYEKLWGAQNSFRVFDYFSYKIYELFGDSVNVQQLSIRTCEDGMIGLILQILKQITTQAPKTPISKITHNPRMMNLKQSFDERLESNEDLSEIKNVVQQFMETMYQCMESEIYNKFNVEMRRMVVKYREAERIMRKVNEKITAHADLFDLQNHFKGKKRDYQIKIQELLKENEKLTFELKRERGNLENEQKEVRKLTEQIRQLKDNLQKYQHAVLTRVLDNSNYPDPSLSRRFSCGPAIYDKQNFMGASKLNQEPFKLIIDTHITQKDGEPPETKTIATICNMPGTLPEGNPVESRLIQNQMGFYNQEQPLSAYGRLSSSRRPYQ